MKHTFYNVGHGDTIFIKPDDGEKRLIVRDMGCYSGISSNNGMKAALHDLKQYIDKDYSIDVIISHAHIDHYKGFKKLYDDGERKIFKNTYIPYLDDSNRSSLLWSVFVISVGMYLYFPVYSYYYRKAKEWLLLAPIMADLSTQVIGVSNVSAGINLGHSHLNFLWPPEKNFTNLDSKELNTFVRTIFAESDFVKEEDNNLFEAFCDEVYHEITRCFDDQGRTDHASTVLRILEEKKEQVFESQEANFFVNIFKDASIGKKYKHSVDNHSIVFDIEKESFYLSDICEDAMDAMFNQCGCRIASQYPLLKSAHHGTRICDDLKKMKFSKIIHCCGKGNRRYGRPLNDYNQMNSTVVYMDAVKAAKQTF